MKLRKKSEYVYEIPKEGDMNVPGRIYASEKLIENVNSDKTVEQIKNVASLPGILEQSICLSDAQQGYGFPVGGVAAFDKNKGIITPGGIGFDINCGIRLLKTNLKKRQIKKNRKKVANALKNKIPSGVGRGSTFTMTQKELDEILKGGAQEMVKKGYGIKEDYLNVEEEGKVENAEPSKVSGRAKKRGIGKLGTLGAGNHFLDVLYIDKIFDKKIAKKMNLRKGQIMVMIHTGSRGLGHQVASDYVKSVENKFGKKIKNLPDKELAYVPIKSNLAKNYLKAMNAASNFAFANRQLITFWTREEMGNLFPKSRVETLYEICHNIAKFEKHRVRGKDKEICVIRKGATRSFGPGRKEIPLKYREMGSPVILPGSMGTSSYLLVGTKEAERLTFGSCSHGAGRNKSRTSAKKFQKGEDVINKLQKKGIFVKSSSMDNIAEEAPEAYKDVDEVLRVIEKLKLGKKVVKMKPLIVLMG